MNTAPKSRAGLVIGIGCCLLAGVLIVVLAFIGVFVFMSNDDPKGPPTTTGEPVDPTDEPTDDPTDGPTSDDPADDPTDEPTDEPTDDPTSTTSSITIGFVDSGEASELETSKGVISPENGIFLGTQVEITNNNDVEIGLARDNFRVYDQDGTELNIRYGEYTTAGPQIPVGETAEARLWVDVEPGTTISRLTYADPVGTNGVEVEFPLQ
ncbi:PT domain-containing protein [Brachybacterium epidermidis]|uniref:PT domain-containing protein n=1 Tax=Brachybacterium epidermidis TaxID=2781983 RepID=UPI00398ECE8E